MLRSNKIQNCTMRASAIFSFCFCSSQKTAKFHNAWVGASSFFFFFAIPFISEFRTGVFTFRSWIKHFRRQRCFSFPVLQVNISLPFAMLKVSNSKLQCACVCFQKQCIYTGKGIPCFGRIQFADLTLKPRLAEHPHRHTHRRSVFFSCM